MDQLLGLLTGWWNVLQDAFNRDIPNYTNSMYRAAQF